MVVWSCKRGELAYDGAEEVALLLGVRWRRSYVVRKWRPIENVHPEPADHFMVTKHDLRPGELERIIGVVHSHPSGDPSPSGNDIKLIPSGWLGAVWCDGELGGWHTAIGEVPVHERTPAR